MKLAGTRVFNGKTINSKGLLFQDGVVIFYKAVSGECPPSLISLGKNQVWLQGNTTEWQECADFLLELWIDCMNRFENSDLIWEYWAKESLVKEVLNGNRDKTKFKLWSENA